MPSAGGAFLDAVGVPLPYSHHGELAAPVSPLPAFAACTTSPTRAPTQDVARASEGGLPPLAKLLLNTAGQASPWSWPPYERGRGRYQWVLNPTGLGLGVTHKGTLARLRLALDKMMKNKRIVISTLGGVRRGVCACGGQHTSPREAGRRPASPTCCVSACGRTQAASRGGWTPLRRPAGRAT